MTDWTQSKPTREGAYWFYKNDEMQLLWVWVASNGDWYCDRFIIPQEMPLPSDGWWLRIIEPKPPVQQTLGSQS